MGEDESIEITQTTNWKINKRAPLIKTALFQFARCSGVKENVLFINTFRNVY